MFFGQYAMHCGCQRINEKTYSFHEKIMRCTGSSGTSSRVIFVAGNPQKSKMASSSSKRDERQTLVECFGCIFVNVYLLFRSLVGYTLVKCVESDSHVKKN